MTEMQNKIGAGVLCVLLLFPGGASAQQTPSVPTPSVPTPAKAPVFVPGATPGVQNGGERVAAAPGLKIVVLEGRNRINRLTEGIFAMPVVEVRDSNDRPIEGAQVTFLLNGGPGAGAMFRDGSLEKTFSTTAQGQAAAEGYVPNNVEGKFSIRIRAKYLEESIEIRLEQANSFQLQADADRKKSRAWRKWAWIGGAVAAGAIVAVVLTGGDSTPAPPSVIINPGPPVFGGR